MKFDRSKRKQRRRGTTTVEFAVMLPIMFLLIVGSIQLFRFYSVANSMELAVMEGARRGLLPKSNEVDAIDAAKSYLSMAGISQANVTAIRETNASGQLELYVSASMPLTGNGFLVPQSKKLVVFRDCRIRCESN